jgi:BirA family biotin operon repressor/biotin-[acetyl-CoA-carboxylase] ligase
VQTAGIGSRENGWEGYRGNLFLSFAIPLQDLPGDLHIASASIYFASLLQEVLQRNNSHVWLKWPNDFYIKNLKIGGMITNVVEHFLVCGVGINLKKAPDGFGILDIEIDKKILVEQYIKNVEKKVLWKQVFSKYKLEFDRNKNFSTHYKNVKISLKDAKLEEDGSLNIDGERIYSLR